MASVTRGVTVTRMVAALALAGVGCGEGAETSRDTDGSATTPTASITASAGPSGPTGITITGGSETEGSTGPGTSSGPTSPTQPTQSTQPTSTTGTNWSDSDDTLGECAEISEMAEVGPRPADIIFAIDTSGSMDVEAASVQDKMNLFANLITNVGIDAHVVVLASNEVCIPAPLGSGQCPLDTKLPNFLHLVSVPISSSNSLTQILSSYPEWEFMMRPHGKKHVIVVSDDDAGGITAQDFHQQFSNLGPGFADYAFHGIVSASDLTPPFCGMDACCWNTADKGETYLELINITGGLWGDLCLQEFGPVFTEISTLVIEAAPLSCEFPIPEPEGWPIDFDEVNVEVDTGNGAQAIPKVLGPGDCGQAPDAWHYDNEDDPATIVLCPQTCTKVQANENAAINVTFGCETLIPG